MRRLTLATLLWLGLASAPEIFASRHACRWHDLVDTALAGPEAWGAASTWGLRSRWARCARYERQHATDGCGAAALHAFLADHRPRPTQDLLWSLCRAPHGGATLGRLASVARRFGARCEVIWAPSLHELAAPAVLHLARGHFVLLARTDGTNACVLDPACGWVRLPWAALGPRCSGAVLVRRGGEARS